MLRHHLLALGLILAAAGAAAAHDVGSAPAGDGAAPTASSVHGEAERYFTNLPVVTQDGETLRFYDDVLKDKVVLVSLFYTGCSDACPLITAKMAAVQDRLGGAMGRTIHFVSISVDPRTDRPEVLKSYAANFVAGKGWRFLTGDEADLMTITHRLGQPDGNPMAHPPFLLVGDTRRGYWRKFLPDVSEEALTTFLVELASRP
jgi:protein SCO1